MRQDPSLSRLIPETALRNLYEFLRAFGKKQFHLQCAEEFKRNPKALDKIIRRSFSHFSIYDNQSEPFHQRQSEEGPTARRQSSNQTANRFVVALDKQRTVQVDGGLSFDYVAYDVSPFRTTGGTSFESGTSGQSSGRGGLDLLLANSQDRLPIVGEIKAGDDTTLLLALIQSLTYAVEISTPNQQRRLANAHPEQFKFPKQGPSVDVYIFLVRSNKKWTDKFLKIVDPLCRSLLKREFVPTLIRRIACMSTSFEADKTVTFDVQFEYRGS